MPRSDRCRSFSIYFADDDWQIQRTRLRALFPYRKASAMTAPLFALHELQSGDVQDLDRSRRDAPNQALALQFCEGAFGGLRYRSKIIREIETIHRQLEERSLLIEELGEMQEIKNERGKTLTRVLLTECHDTMLGLTEIIGAFHKQVQLKLRFRQHHLLHSLPSDAIDSGWTDRLCRVDVSSVLGTTQKIAWHPECQNLPAAILGAPAYADDSFIDEVEKIGSFSFGEDNISTAPVDERCRALEELLLFLSREQIPDGRRLGTRSVKWPRTKLQARSVRARARERGGAFLLFGELQDHTDLGCAEICRLPLRQMLERHQALARICPTEAISRRLDDVPQPHSRDVPAAFSARNRHPARLDLNMYPTVSEYANCDKLDKKIATPACFCCALIQI
jgi:hypothetical protein